MRRDYKVYLEDILEAIGRIRKYTSGVTAESLGSDTKTLDAILRNLETTRSLHGIRPTVPF